MTENEKKVNETLEGKGRTSAILRGVNMLCVYMLEAGRDGKINQRVKKLEVIEELVREALLKATLKGLALKDNDAGAFKDYHLKQVSAMAELVDLLDEKEAR